MGNSSYPATPFTWVSGCSPAGAHQGAVMVDEVAANDQAAAAARDTKLGVQRTAVTCRALTDAFIEAGFTPDEAYGLTAVILAGVSGA